MSTISGHCNCSAIKIEIPKQTENTLCHDLPAQPRADFASASGNFTVDVSSMKVEGEPKKYDQSGESGQAVHRFFCGDCGSPLWTAVDVMEGKAFVKTGLFDVGDIPKVSCHMFARNMEEWEKPYPGAKVLDSQ